MPRPSKGRKWVLVKHFEGFPKKSDMRIEEFSIPALKEGEFLMEAEFLSVDPYMRLFSANLKLGDMMMGQQVAKVIETRNPDFPVGTWTVPNCGWTTHCVSNGKEKILGVVDSTVWKMPQLPEGVPRSYALGTLGMPGVAAVMGLLDICEPKSGEVVLVSGAAGAVGNVVGQLAKSKGCIVIGSAGSEEKIKYLKSIGFDVVFNYKTSNLGEALQTLNKDGIDVFFDNVGGEAAAQAVLKMNDFGRITNCGAISSYNESNPEKITSIFSKMVTGQIKMQGFVVYSHLPEWSDKILKELAPLVKQGKIKVREHVTKGFDNTFTAFAELFTGANTGKAVVQV